MNPYRKTEGGEQCYPSRPPFTTSEPLAPRLHLLAANGRPVERLDDAVRFGVGNLDKAELVRDVDRADERRVDASLVRDGADQVPWPDLRHAAEGNVDPDEARVLRAVTALGRSFGARALL